MGLKKPIGARLTGADDFLNPPNGPNYVYTVVGVIKDFHYQSMHQKISPLIFVNADRFGGEMGTTGVRIEGDNFGPAVERIGKVWKGYVPDHALRYDFLDRKLADQYNSEHVTQRIFNIFSVLAIFIACIEYMLQACGLCDTVACARDRDTKGARREQWQYRGNALEGLFDIDSHRHGHCIPFGMVGDAGMAAGLRVPHRYLLVDIRLSRSYCDFDCPVHDQFSCDQGSSGKPCDKPEDRMN